MLVKVVPFSTNLKPNDTDISVSSDFERGQLDAGAKFQRVLLS